MGYESLVDTRPGRISALADSALGNDSVLDEEAPFDWPTLTARDLPGARPRSFLTFNSPSPLQI
jgi:hypothetical protein